MSDKSFSSVVFAGDFCPSGDDFAEQFRTSNLNPWASIGSVCGDHVAIIANLECPFTGEDKGLPFKWANLKAATDLHLVLDGLDFAILGNNHLFDFGINGIKDTIELLSGKNIKTVGFGASVDDALKPAFLDINGKNLGVISLCCPTTNSENLATNITSGVAPLGMQTLNQGIEAVKLQCDALVTYLHWGCEGVHDPAPDQLRLARHAIDCGADAVIGCHSHTIQSFERYRGRWIFYGLGNYMFRAGYAQQILENGRIQKIPLILDPSNRESLLVQFSIVPDDGQGRLSLKTVQPMRFGDDNIPRPITFDELSFDIKNCNSDLINYVSNNEKYLCDKSEPEYISRLRNGILSYWYRRDTIRPPVIKNNYFTNNIIRRTISLIKIFLSMIK